uniref:MspA family porin n=1 Tax=Nocardia cyriacigeorgica TaxID=135487 RepID=UPI0024571E23
LNHSGIAGIYDYGETVDPQGGEVAYLVMELVQGEPLNTGYIVGCQVSIGDEAISAGVSGSVDLDGASVGGSVGLELAQPLGPLTAERQRVGRPVQQTIQQGRSRSVGFAPTPPPPQITPPAAAPGAGAAAPGHGG